MFLGSDNMSKNEVFVEDKLSDDIALENIRPETIDDYNALMILKVLKKYHKAVMHISKLIELIPLARRNSMVSLYIETFNFL